MPLYLTRFPKCKHEVQVDVRVDDDTEVIPPLSAIGPCPECTGADLIAIADVTPQGGGKGLVVTSVMMMPRP